MASGDALYVNAVSVIEAGQLLERQAQCQHDKQPLSRLNHFGQFPRSQHQPQRPPNQHPAV